MKVSRRVIPGHLKSKGREMRTRKIIPMPDGASGNGHLHRLANGYRAALLMFHPELPVYVAGANPVIGTALTHQVPVAIVLAGGYAQSVEDTITIHANTAAVAKDVLEKVA